MQYGFRALDLRPDRVRAFRLAAVMLVVLSALAFGTMSYVAAVARPRSSGARPAAQTRAPAAAASVLAGTPDMVTAAVARDLFAAAPVVVVADPDHPAAWRTAAALARRAAAPLLLTPGRAGPGLPVLRAEVSALRPRAVLAVGVPGQSALGAAARDSRGHRSARAARDQDSSARAPGDAARAPGRLRRRQDGGRRHRAGGRRAGGYRPRATTRGVTRPPLPPCRPPGRSTSWPSGPGSGRRPGWLPGSRWP